METTRRDRQGEISSHIFIILVTLAQLIFFTFFHKYIAWHTTGPDGSSIRLSMLTDEYFIWLPVMITGSIIVILASMVMIINNSYIFGKIGEISFSVIGIIISVSLVSIFPFDFSVIPNATAADIVPVIVTVFFILLPVFYATTAVIIFIRLRKYMAGRDSG